MKQFIFSVFLRFFANSLSKALIESFYYSLLVSVFVHKIIVSFNINYSLYMVFDVICLLFIAQRSSKSTLVLKKQVYWYFLRIMRTFIFWGEVEWISLWNLFYWLLSKNFIINENRAEESWVDLVNGVVSCRLIDPILIKRICSSHKNLRIAYISVWLLLQGIFFTFFSKPLLF